MYRCYFVPRQFRPEEAEQDMLRLRERLCSLREILRRSLVSDPVLAGVLLSWNLRYRAETRQIARALREKAAASEEEAKAALRPPRCRHHCARAGAGPSYITLPKAPSAAGAGDR
jgi:hypothetical protein